MFYNGYTGSVTYSVEDDCLIGEVLGIRDSISYEGTSIDEIRRDFHNTIDSYLKSCIEWDRKPDVPHEAEITLTIPADAHEYLYEVAEKSGRTIAATAMEILIAAKTKAERARRQPKGVGA